jgi:hypothetical protein
MGTAAVLAILFVVVAAAAAVVIAINCALGRACQRSGDHDASTSDRQ